MTSEYDEQKALVQWLKAKKIFHFANTSENNTFKQDRKYAMIAEGKAKAAGKIKGIPDLTIFLPTRILYLELKRQKKVLKSGELSNSHSKPNVQQLVVIDKINDYPYAISLVGYGAKESIELIKEILNK